MKQIKRKLIKLYKDSYKVRRDISELTLMTVTLLGVVSLLLAASILLLKLTALGYGWAMFSVVVIIASFCCLSVIWDNKRK